jgi:acetate kinase
MTDAAIAVINAGSSSIKFALYADAPDLPLLFRGQIEQIGVAPHLSARDASGNPVAEASWPAKGFNHRSATRIVLETARDLLAGAKVRGVGHRVVHGGIDFGEPVLVDGDVLAALETLKPLAPLHQPHNLAPIAAIAEAAPHIAQVACFDTAFHRRQSELAQMFAVPRRLTEAGVRRYGFHGLSYEYVSQRLAEIAPGLHEGRVIVCHLGNGASLCALKGGASVATTMGFTAVDGLMMGTRCGTLDPGVLIYLMDEEKMDARGIENLVYRQSGLLGVSGISSDMRALRASEAPEAGEAIALFVYRVVREIGSLAAALGGLDALVFTGGIGEHDALTRREIAEGCAWLGLALDDAHNQAGAGQISAEGSRIAAWVVPTDEEKMIARHTAALLGLSRPELRPEAQPALP